MARLSGDVERLLKAVGIVDPNDQLYRSMKEQQEQGDDSQAFLRGLGVAGAAGSSLNAGSGSGGDYALLNFSTDQLASLQKGALNRQVTTNATISSTTADMAGVPAYDFNVFPYLR